MLFREKNEGIYTQPAEQPKQDMCVEYSHLYQAYISHPSPRFS